MEERRLIIRKKTALLNVKRELEQFKCFQIIAIIEAESEEVLNYRNQTNEMNLYSYPIMAAKKINKNSDVMVEWFFQKISILKDNVIWIMPFDKMGIWWIKVKVINCKEAIEKLWIEKGGMCIIEMESRECYYIQIYEEDCHIVYKQLQ